MLLVVFGFVAGMATAVSPCVLPVLPVVLAAGSTGGRRRPLGIAVGLAVSFTFATIAFVYVISALGLPNNTLRFVAVAVLLTFGIVILVPALGARVEAAISRLTSRTRLREADGFWSGTLLGGGLGFLYAPCAGPILAGVITVSASQEFTANRLAIAIAYGLGSAIMLFLLMLGGRRLTTRLSRNNARLQIAMGSVMVLVAVAMAFEYDIRFQTALAKSLPAVVVNPSKALQQSDITQRELRELRSDRRRPFATGAAQPGSQSALPNLGRAPEIVGTQKWFNTPGGGKLTLAELRGRVVLVDFWTYSCIDCIRTIPHLKALDAKYQGKGLTVIGVHSPEFTFERSAGSVARAVKQNGVGYPVAQDNKFATWDAYGNEFWPAHYLIDPRGRVRQITEGEGHHERTERAIRSLLTEAGARDLGSRTDVDGTQVNLKKITPESYLGASRAERFTNGAIRGGVQDFRTSPDALDLNQLRYSGRWNIAGAPATAVGPRSQLELRFRAQRVFLVLKARPLGRKVRVSLDGRPIDADRMGGDVRGDSTVSVGESRLYRLVDLPRVETHTLLLQFEPGVTGYAFTFG